MGPLLQAEGVAGATSLGLGVALAALTLLVLGAVLSLRRDLAAAMGFSFGDVALLTVGALAGQVLSVPIATPDDAVLAINLGGALVPLLLTGRLLARGTLSWRPLLAGTAVVGLVTFAIVDVEAGRGVVAPFPWVLLPPTIALLVGIAGGRGELTRAGPLAFGSGSVGALLGADAAVLPALDRLTEGAAPGTSLVIGGAGAFDLVFLTGAVGLALALLVAVGASPSAARIGQPGPPVRVPRPQGVIERAGTLPGLGPRERAAVHLARANEAIARGEGAVASREARDAVEVLLQAGRPRLLDRIQGEAGEPGVRRQLHELTQRLLAADRDEPAHHEALETLELAKHVAGALWDDVPGEDRLGVTRE